LPRFDNSRSLPTSSPEVVPLVVGIFAISIPVGLVALAAVGGGVVVLVFAVLAMLVVAMATLTFVFVLTDDQPDELDSSTDI
jgi:fatty acid desaturase